PTRRSRKNRPENGRQTRAAPRIANAPWPARHRSTGSLADLDVDSAAVEALSAGPPPRYAYPDATELLITADPRPERQRSGSGAAPLTPWPLRRHERRRATTASGTPAPLRRREALRWRRRPRPALNLTFRRTRARSCSARARGSRLP